MRISLSRRSLAAAYLLGLVWLVAMIGAAVALVQPMAALYETLGIESAVAAAFMTWSLAIVLATLAAAGAGLVLRSKPFAAKARHGA